MTTSKLIAPGEMAADQIITILSPSDNEDVRSPYTGVPMRVLSVDLPFLAVDVLAGGGGRLILDSRLHTFMELRRDFAAAFGKSDPSEESEADRATRLKAQLLHAAEGHIREKIKAATEEALAQSEENLQRGRKIALRAASVVFALGGVIGFVIGKVF